MTLSGYDRQQTYSSDGKTQYIVTVPRLDMLSILLGAFAPFLNEDEQYELLQSIKAIHAQILNKRLR